MKLFDEIAMEETFEKVSTFESTVLAMEEQSMAEAEILKIYAAIEDGKQQVAMLEKDIKTAEVALENGTVDKLFVAQYLTSVQKSFDVLGFEGLDFSEIGLEEITDPTSSLISAVEESKSAITKIIIAINKTFARLEASLLKFMDKLNIVIDKLFTDLEDTKSKLEEYEKSGKKLTLSEISDTNVIGWQTGKFIGIMGFGGTKDPIKAMNGIIKKYGSADFIDKTTNAIISMMTKDGDVEQIFDNTSALKQVQRSWIEKVFKFFCKSGDRDYLLVGATNNQAWFLNRCKPLHITSDMMPYHYTTRSIPFSMVDGFGITPTFTTPDLKELIKLCDEALKIVQNRKKVKESVFNILKKGSKEIDKIDEAAKWETVGIYPYLPFTLLVLTKTYWNIPTAVDGLGKVYLQNLKEA